MSTINILSPKELRRAADLKDQIVALEKELTQILDPPAPIVAAAPVKKKTKFSAAGIARIKAAQKARWAKIKSAKSIIVVKTTDAAKAPVKKGKISAAAKAKLSAKLKVAWARRKAAQK